MTMHLQTSKEMLNETSSFSSQIHGTPSYMSSETGGQDEVSDAVYGVKTSSTGLYEVLNAKSRGWWKTRSKMEKKLVVLSSFLFLLSFCLIIGIGVVASRHARPKSIVRVSTPGESTTDDSTSSVTISSSNSLSENSNDDTTVHTTVSEDILNATSTTKSPDALAVQSTDSQPSINEKSSTYFTDKISSTYFTDKISSTYFTDKISSVDSTDEIASSNAAIENLSTNDAVEQSPIDAAEN